MTRHDWRDEAACATADPLLFDATSYDTARPALAYCETCPVTGWCRQSRGGSQSGLTGVWGGRVYGPNGHEVFAPVAAEVAPPREHVGVCEGCGRPVTSRGRDACPHRGSLCRRLASEYHAAKYQARKAGVAA